MDETYIKVKGPSRQIALQSPAGNEWMYLYRTIDKHPSRDLLRKPCQAMGKTLDFMLSKHRDKVAASLLFRRAIETNGLPTRIVIDKSRANLASLQRTNIGLKFSRTKQRVEMLRVKYLNNIVEQDHRFIKKITWPTLCFKAFHSAAVTLAGIEVAHMIRKRQFQSSHTSPFKQFASLAA